MKLYQGTKIVRAKQMSYGEFCKLKGLETFSTEEGYLVEYQNDSEPNIPGFEGYVSWSPKKPFEEAYRPAETWYERLEIEIEELKTKIDKLQEFLLKLGDNDSGELVLSHEAFALLKEQFGHMQAYYYCLVKRLEVAQNN